MSAKPNILFVMTDQQRWDALGCFAGEGGAWLKTPHLDALAKEGVCFSNCVTNSPVCMPARLALATGRYPHNFGTWKNGGYQLPQNAPTWMKAIRKQGYRTSLFGKTHLHLRHDNDLRGDEHLLNAYGYDDVNEIVGPRASAITLSHMTAQWEEKGLWQAYKDDLYERQVSSPHCVRPSTLPLEDYYDVYIAQQAKAYLEGYQYQQPWFCTLSFGGPHEPWDAPEPYASLYDPAQMPVAHKAVSLTPEQPKSTLHNRLKIAPQLGPDEVAELRANYAGSVTLIDDQIGQVLEVIRARGEWDNTVVLFTSDHGEMNGDHGLIHKNTFLNSAVRVPLIVRTPQSSQSGKGLRYSDEVVELIDVGATLAEAAGAELEYHHFSQSVLPLVEGDKATHRSDVLSEFKGEFMLMTKRYKLVVNRRGEPALLFDLENDFNEQNNLVSNLEMKSVIDELRLRLLDRLVQSQNYSSSIGGKLPAFAQD